MAKSGRLSKTAEKKVSPHKVFRKTAVVFAGRAPYFARQTSSNVHKIFIESRKGDLRMLARRREPLKNTETKKPPRTCGRDSNRAIFRKYNIQTIMTQNFKVSRKQNFCRSNPDNVPGG